MRFRALVPIVPIVVTAAVVAAAGQGILELDPPRSHPRHQQTQTVAPFTVPLNAAEQHARTRWYFAAHQAAVHAWLDGVRQAELARHAATRGRRSASTSYAGVGDCSGFAIPDYIIQRESGGNPYAVNRSSGAFGCAQVMPMHWHGGACADLDRYNIDHQRECVWRLSDGGTNLQPWAATR